MIAMEELIVVKLISVMTLYVRVIVAQLNAKIALFVILTSVKISLVHRVCVQTQLKQTQLFVRIVVQKSVITSIAMIAMPGVLMMRWVIVDTQTAHVNVVHSAIMRHRVVIIQTRKVCYKVVVNVANHLVQAHKVIPMLLLSLVRNIPYNANKCY
jgi:hypothetical protein